VHRSARGYSGRAAVGTWIISVALNVARHHARSETRRRTAMAAVAHATIEGQAHRPDDRASHRQSLERLRVGIEELPYDFRVVFLLCDLEGLKGTDAARALGIPEGTVWRRLHEARTRLRALVGEESDQ
jgi:RNA polymerase sigma-70 factor (ECF subfamily)